MITEDTQDGPEHLPRPVLLLESGPTLRLMVASLLRRWGFRVDNQAVPGTCYALMIAAPLASDPVQDALRRSMRELGIPWLALLPAGGDGVAGGTRTVASKTGAIETEADSLAADADGWVRKPVTAEALHDAVMRCVGRREEEPGPDGLDLAAIGALWGSSGDATFHRIAAVFIEEMDGRMAAIDTGIAVMNRAHLLLEAHSIASAAGNVGCARLARAARRLEHEVAMADEDRVGRLVRELQGSAARDLMALRALVGG